MATVFANALNYPGFSVTSGGTATLTNTILLANSVQFADPTDISKQFTVSLSGKTSATAANFIFTGGGQNITFPNGNYNVSTSGANNYTGAQTVAFSTLTDASTITPDFSLSNNYNLVLTGNHTLGVPTNLVAGQTGVITVRQDITGSRTLAYAWPYQFPTGVAPVLSTAKLAFDQLYYSVNAYATATVTLSIASPCVVTWTAHGLISGQIIQLSTTGALPSPLAANTTYWVTVIDANTFNISTSLANAQAATFISTVGGTQSGVQTATNASITISYNLGVA